VAFFNHLGTLQTLMDKTEALFVEVRHSDDAAATMELPILERTSSSFELPVLGATDGSQFPNLRECRNGQPLGGPWLQAVVLAGFVCS